MGNTKLHPWGKRKVRFLQLARAFVIIAIFQQFLFLRTAHVANSSHEPWETPSFIHKEKEKKNISDVSFKPTHFIVLPSSEVNSLHFETMYRCISWEIQILALENFHAWQQQKLLENCNNNKQHTSMPFTAKLLNNTECEKCYIVFAKASYLATHIKVKVKG